MSGLGETTKFELQDRGRKENVKKFIRIKKEDESNLRDSLLYNATMALKSAEYFEKQVGGARTSNYFQECIENLNEIKLLSGGKVNNKIIELIEDAENRQLVQILRSFDEQKASVN
jgi:UDP-3-O-acyl-N-acetylglucosamine deacetylase